MLQDVPAAQAQAAASPNLQSFFSNPNLINMASQMLQDPSMQHMMQNIMQSFQTGTAGGGGMENLLQMGQAIAQQIQTSNPNLVDQLTGQAPGDGAPGPNNGPNNDGSSNQ